MEPYNEKTCSAVSATPPIDAALRGVEGAVESACDDLFGLRLRFDDALAPAADCSEKACAEPSAPQSDLTRRLWVVHDRIRLMQRVMAEMMDRCELPYSAPKAEPAYPDCVAVSRAR